MRRFISQDRELCAGEMLRLAGYSAGRSVCARGGTVCGACGSVGMSCVRFTPAMRFCWDVWRLVHACHAVLLECLAFGSRLPCGSVGMSCVWFTPAVRFCWDVWRLVHACRAVLLECLAFGSRLSLFLCQEKRDGLRYVPFLFRRVEIATRAFSQRPSVICLGWFTSGFRVSLWRSRRGYRGRGERKTGLRRNGAGGAAFVRFCAGALTLQVFPRGVRWGLRAPKPAPKSLRLSGLSSRCGGVALVRNRRAVARAYGNPCPAPISGGRTAAGRASRVMLRGSKWKPHSGRSRYS